MIDIILYQPEIPQNTGSIGRLCAYTSCRLNLIHPLGFTINDKNLRRAGMDYWKELNVIEHDSWENFTRSPDRPKRIHLLSTHAEKSIWNAEFMKGDGLLFGNEGHGVPDFVHNWVDQRICIPKFNNQLRSLNLAVSVGIASYEAFRQIQA